jgi:hypothetical protein
MLMTRIRTLIGTTALLAVSSIVLPKSAALAQVGIPWVLTPSTGMDVSECKRRADKFLESKGFDRQSPDTQPHFAIVEAATQELAVLVHCIKDGRSNNELRISVVAVKRKDSVAEATVEQLRKDVLNAIKKQ